jgi:penicillin-binding protein A
MNREIRRVSVALLVMFFALCASSTVITALQADNLRADGRNVRTLYDSYSTQRGPILVDGEAIAYSTPVDSEYRYLRTYTQPELYANITGYFTLNQGNTGIEGALNDYLSGTSNDQFFAQLNAIFTGQEAKGAAVELTIDPVVQQAAWDALGDHLGSVVALDPQTGAVLAMVSKPSYDPNLLASHSTAEVMNAYDTLLADPSDPLINRAIAGDLYHPGSTFKVVVSAAALDSGAMTPDTAVPNPAQLQLPQSNSVVHNASGGTCGPGEQVTLADALRLSCNIPFAEIGGALGDDLMRQYSESFGFGRPLSVPMRVTPSHYPDNPDAAQTMLSAFGQSDVRATPLQMAMVSAAVANGGVLLKPELVESITAADLSEIEGFQPEVFSNPISPETSATLVQLMVNNVANGAASNARISGVNVGGKTGTSENGEGEPYTLWFTGFAPAEDPQVAVAVVIEDGGRSSGNAEAAPIARRVMEAVLSR